MHGRICVIGAATLCAAALVAGGTGPSRALAGGPRSQPKQPVAYGTGGGAATMSRYATAAATNVLRGGGNAVDAAVAAATTLGVTEPFVAGPGGGGFFVYYRARDHRVFTIDGREKAPSHARPDMFLDSSGNPLPFEQAVESGVSVGVPGQLATWAQALKHFGSEKLATLLHPAEQVARSGFPLDASLVSAIQTNKDKLAHFPAAKALYLPGGNVPPQGYVLRNPDLARTYQQIGKHGWRWFYTGPIGRQLAAETRHPQTSPGTTPVAGGTMTAADMRHYTAPLTKPVSWRYRGYTLWGMAPPTSGGTTIGEAMNILSNFDQRGNREDALYRYIEANKLAYADRNQYLGDPKFVAVPTHGLLSPAFAKTRAAKIGPTAATAPVPYGDPWPFNGGGSAAVLETSSGRDGQHTNHLVVADKRGDVVSYTNTIEQIAGSGILLAHRGFLLNNELTDFNFPTGTANSAAPNKRPRSSMSPSLITRGGRIVEALGSPGGSTIITTVEQTLLDQLDFGMSLPDAIEAPRASPSNSNTVTAEPAFIDADGAALEARGESFTSTPYIGIAAGLAFLPRRHLETATEAWRGGGGSAMVVHPENPEPAHTARVLGR